MGSSTCGLATACWRERDDGLAGARVRCRPRRRRSPPEVRDLDRMDAIDLHGTGLAQGQRQRAGLGGQGQAFGVLHGNLERGRAADDRDGGGRVGVLVDAEHPQVLRHDARHHPVLGLAVGVGAAGDIAGQHHVDPVAGHDVAAGAGDLVDGDGVGAHARRDQGGQGGALADAGQLGRQHRLLRLHRHQGRGRAALLGEQLIDRAVGARRRGVGRQLGERQVFLLQLDPIGDRLGGDDHRHAFHWRGGLAGRHGGMAWHPDPRHDQGADAERGGSAQRDDCG